MNKEIPEVKIDLRYYSKNNFMGDTIDGYYANKCILSVDATKALSDVQKELSQKDLSLKVFDAYRPQRAVDHFVRWAQNLADTMMKSQYYPYVPKSILFTEGYIAERSGHTRGSTLDLTIVNNVGVELDMGTPWDYFGPESWLANENLTSVQISNRQLLQTVMKKYGFRSYEKEWWHFTLENEPFPDTYFDFPIK